MCSGYLLFQKRPKLWRRPSDQGILGKALDYHIEVGESGTELLVL